MEFHFANNNSLVSVLSRTDKTEMYHVFWKYKKIKNIPLTNNSLEIWLEAMYAG